jgi:hypothetical protein
MMCASHSTLGVAPTSAWPEDSNACKFLNTSVC